MSTTARKTTESNETPTTTAADLLAKSALRRQAISLKRNKSRKLVRDAVKQEKQDEALGAHGRDKQKRLKRKKKLEEKIARLKEEGVNPERIYQLTQEQGKLEYKFKKSQKGKKRQGEDYCGHTVKYRSFMKRFANQSNDYFSKEAYEANKQQVGDEFYSGRCY
eukprot:TRINITY_DN8997_c0_g1_i2.p1 TRINITY_DN8997_c0_g1~~TRINITY_DN8997_c0_g1_i2.p1  ORF type:complete len:164 (+),score=21.27 TRINITY_DN8997_c0_g1_i2:192-683(+)